MNPRPCVWFDRVRVGVEAYNRITTLQCIISSLCVPIGKLYYSYT